MRLSLRGSAIFVVRTAVVLCALAFSLAAQGKNPVILIPGLTGSELIDKKSGDKIWIRAFKSKNEDLRLPISADPVKAGDGLIPGDIVRNIKVGPFEVADFYEKFIEAMEVRGGYHEEKWSEPSADGSHDSLYVFPYDWRLDIVTNAQRLVTDVEELKRKLKSPDIKFDIVGHSMGGLIARYAAMYGKADLPSGNRKAVPTWAGERHFDKVILLATPNEGAAASLDAFIHGYSIKGFTLDLPFVTDTSRFTIFTCPSAYQLLPAPGTVKIYDDKLDAISVDIYDPKVWSKYGWNPMTDSNFVSQFSAAERKAAPVFFEAALERAKHFHQALAAAKGNSGDITFHSVGSDCKTALDAVLLYRDEKNDKWRTLFRPKGFTRSDGHKITDDDLRSIMIAPGDGTVTRRSFEMQTQGEMLKVASVAGSKTTQFFCESHSKLAANSRVQDHIISLLGSNTDRVADKTR